MRKHIFLLLGLFFLTACSSFSKGLVEGFIDAQEKKKDDVSCSIMSSGFDGLQRSKEKTIKVLLVHGIGNHVPGHSMAFMLDLAKRMGMNTLHRDFKEIKMTDEQGNFVGTLRVYRFKNHLTGNNIVFYEQTWSSITAPIKENLSYDTTKEYAQKRSAVNAQMKYYLNSTLPDTVIYFGQKGETLLSSATQSFCWMTNYSYDDLPDNVQENCSVSAKKAIDSLSKENFVFITNSLGSQIAIDALQQMAQKIYALPKANSDTQKALSLLREKEITIFMLANQLPLLQMGRTQPLHIGQWKDYCSVDGKKYHQRLFKLLNIVAISDPNDLLSYGLEPNSADKYLDSALCPQVSNVSITTTTTVNLGFGELANPLSAHTNYQKNPYVLDLIVEGLRFGYTSPAIDEKCHWVQLEN